MVLDGAKALSAAVRDVFDHPVIGRCQIHKLRNVRDHLPENLRGLVTKRIRAGHHATESMVGICREHAQNVQRWRDGQMALRWCAAGMVEATGQFRRVNGHLHLPALRAALETHVAATTVTTTVGAECSTQTVAVA